jgi:hypothetical protein
LTNKGCVNVCECDTGELDAGEDSRAEEKGRGWDYQMKEMATVMDTPESIAHLYESYVAFARRKKGIVYAIDREHAKHIAAYYQSKG